MADDEELEQRIVEDIGRQWSGVASGRGMRPARDLRNTGEPLPHLAPGLGDFGREMLEIRLEVRRDGLRSIDGLEPCKDVGLICFEALAAFADLFDLVLHQCQRVKNGG